MFRKSNKVVLIFRVVFRVLALVLLVYLWSQNNITSKELVYQLDWRDSISPNVRGWYPVERTRYQEDELVLVSEPLYLQVYHPDDFTQMQVRGNVESASTTLRLGLKQKDGQWLWNDLANGSNDLNFDLQTAAIKQNKLEFILSIPDLTSTSSVALVNDWQIKFSR